MCTIKGSTEFGGWDFTAAVVLDFDAIGIGIVAVAVVGRVFIVGRATEDPLDLVSESHVN